MNASAIQLDSRVMVAPFGGAPVRGVTSFEDVLNAAGRQERAAQARGAAEQMVASAFIMPVLAKLRESPFLTGPFAPGDAERRFGPLMDQHVADRITAGDHFPLVDQITDHLLAAEARHHGGAGTTRKDQVHGIA
jgi:hypothetical protein